MIHDWCITRYIFYTFELTNRLHRYVKKLVISSWRDNWENVEKGVNTLMAFDPEAKGKGRAYRHTPYAESDMELFEQALTGAEHIFGNEQTLDFWEIEAGREDLIIVCLLLQLINLKYLVVEKMKDSSHFRWAVECISKVEHPEPEPLKRLVEVKLLDDRVDNSTNSLLVKSFARIPSVKHIHSRSIGVPAADRMSALSWIDLKAQSSDVETLTVKCEPRYRHGCEMEAVELFELIEGFKGLRAFSYDSILDLEPFWIRAALVAHAKHSLDTLILRPCVGERSRGRLIGSFRSFEVLKKLELDHTYLADHSGPRRSRFADALPPSLEELHLHDMVETGTRRLKPLWAGKEIYEDKDTHLPNLKVVVFCDDYLAWQPAFLYPGYDHIAPGVTALQAACNAKGFRLEIPKRRLENDSSGKKLP